jgi:DNA-binding transcriptional ArsR family regulator
MRQMGLGLRGALASMERARYTRRQRDALMLARCLREVMDSRDAERIAAAYADLAPDPDSDRWVFVMIGPMQHAAVVRWLSQHSERPQQAVLLWAELFTVLHPGTGEILLSRRQLADRLGVAPGHVSRLMSELVSIGAVRRVRDGRRVRYHMSPHVATHIPGPQARAEARDQAGPLLVLMQGGCRDD